MRLRAMGGSFGFTQAVIQYSARLTPKIARLAAAQLTDISLG
jgi:hypothetical protein